MLDKICEFWFVWFLPIFGMSIVAYITIGLLAGVMSR